MEEVKVEESWNKKKIFAAFSLIVILIIGGYILKTKVLGNKSTPASEHVKSVKGTSSTKEENKEREDINTSSVQKAVKEKLESLKHQAQGLNVLEIASSSPQVQKIINDIKSLEQYPVNQAKEICKQICGL